MVNEVSITSDPLTDLLKRIAERGHRIHDRRLSEEARATPNPTAAFKVINGDLAPLVPRERV